MRISRGEFSFFTMNFLTYKFMEPTLYYDTDTNFLRIWISYTKANNTVYKVLQIFTVILWNFTKFYNFFTIFLIFFTNFYEVLRSFTNFYKVLRSFTNFYEVLQIFMKFYKVLQSSMKFYTFLLTFTNTNTKKTLVWLCLLKLCN